MSIKIRVSAIAVAMACGMGVATADISIYGQTNVSIDATDTDNPAPGIDGDDLNMESNTAAFGIKGIEKISDNLQGVFKYELQTDISQSSNGLTGRDQYLGLQSGFGRLLFGTTSTAYKSPGSKIDPWYRTSIQSRSIGLQSNLHSGKGEEGAGRGQNMIRYDSPKFGGGFGFTATYQLDNDANSDSEDEDPYSLGITYGGNGAYVFASYMDTQQDDGAAFQVGGKYTISLFTFRGIYEKDDGLITDGRSTGSGGDTDADIWSFGIDAVISKIMISLDYGETSDSAGADGISSTADDLEESTVLRIGAQFKLSNRTKAYIGYAGRDFEDTGERETVTLGMSHKF